MVVDDEAVTLEILDTAGQGVSARRPFANYQLLTMDSGKRNMQQWQINGILSAPAFCLCIPSQIDLPSLPYEVYIRTS